MYKLITVVGLLFLLNACQLGPTNNTLYYWGDYSDAVYSYLDNGDLGKQEEELQLIINTVKEVGKPVAPGVYAQLGLVNLQQGKTTEAHNFFLQEQSLYPESTKLIQFLQGKHRSISKGGK